VSPVSGDNGLNDVATEAVAAPGAGEFRPFCYFTSMPTPQQLRHPTYGLPADSYPVRNDQNQIVCVICSFDRPAGTNILVPRIYGRLDGQEGWHDRMPPGYSADDIQQFATSSGKQPDKPAVGANEQAVDPKPGGEQPGEVTAGGSEDAAVVPPGGEQPDKPAAAADQPTVVVHPGDELSGKLVEQAVAPEAGGEQPVEQALVIKHRRKRPRKLVAGGNQVVVVEHDGEPPAKVVAGDNDRALVVGPGGAQPAKLIAGDDEQTKIIQPGDDQARKLAAGDNEKNVVFEPNSAQPVKLIAGAIPLDVVSKPSGEKRRKQVAGDGFDYTNLLASDVEDLRAAAAHIRGLQRQSIDNIIEIGKELIRARGRLEHGQFGAWLKAEFGMLPRNAQRFMRIAERLDGKYDKLSHLTAETAYAVASCSEPVREEVIERLQEGEILQARDIRDLAQAARRAKQNIDRQQVELEPRRDSEIALPAEAQRQDEERDRVAAQAEAAKDAALLIHLHIGDDRDALVDLLTKTTPSNLHRALLEALSSRQQRADEAGTAAANRLGLLSPRLG
jgi:hypothetical protein